MIRRLAPILVLLLATGCARNVGTLVIYVSRSSQVQEDPLDPALVKYLRIRIEGPGMGVVSATFPFTPGGSSTPPPVPVGKSRVITLEGLAGKTGPVVSRGASVPVTIAAGRNQIQLYMGLTGQFSSASGPGLAHARFDATATVLASGEVLIAGGAASGTLASPASPVGSVEVFDPTAGRIVETGDCTAKTGPCLRAPRFGQVAIPEGDAVVLASGRDDTRLVAGVERCTVNDCTGVGSLATPRWRAAGAGQGSGYVVGGDDGTGPTTVVNAITSAPKVTSAPALPSPRADASAVVLKDGTLVVLGGRGPSGDLGDAEVLARGTSTYQEIPGTGTTPRDQGAAVVLGDGRVLWIGGESAGAATDEVDLYDPATKLLCPVGHLVRARWDLAAVRLTDGEVLVAGGLTGSGQPTSEAEILDPRFVPAARTCQAVADTLQARSAPRLAHRRAGHAAVLLPNGLVMVAGGVDENGTALKSIELYVPSS